MKEHDYIEAGDLKTVIAAENVLRDICPTNNPHIPNDEYGKVMDTLRSWRETMFDKINVET